MDGDLVLIFLLIQLCVVAITIILFCQFSLGSSWTLNLNLRQISAVALSHCIRLKQNSSELNEITFFASWNLK